MPNIILFFIILIVGITLFLTASFFMVYVMCACFELADKEMESDEQNEDS